MDFEFTYFEEFAWTQPEPEEGVYDFKWLGKVLEIMAKGSDLYFIRYHTRLVGTQTS